MPSIAPSLAYPEIDRILEVTSRIYPYPGRYRARLFRGPAGRVLLLTDLGAANAGPSVTNAAAEIIAVACTRFGLVATRMRVIEHYDRRRPSGETSARVDTDAEVFTEIVGGLTGLTEANAWQAAIQWRPVAKTMVESWLGAVLP